MGRTGGGVFNTVLKSGTNDFHGDVFGYYRTTDFVGKYVLQQRGGYPARSDVVEQLRRRNGRTDCTFRKSTTARTRPSSMCRQEAYRQHTPVSNNFALPTALEKTGNFSQSAVSFRSDFDPGLHLGRQLPRRNQVRVPFAETSFRPRESILSAKPSSITCRTRRLRRPTLTPPISPETIRLFDRADEYTYKLEHSLTDWIRLNWLFHVLQEPRTGRKPVGDRGGQHHQQHPLPAVSPCGRHGAQCHYDAESHHRCVYSVRLQPVPEFHGRRQRGCGIQRGVLGLSLQLSEPASGPLFSANHSQ